MHFSLSLFLSWKHDTPNRPFTNMSLPAIFQLAKSVLQICHPDVSQMGSVPSAPHLQLGPLWMMSPSALCWCEYLCVPCKPSLISMVIKIQESPDSNFQIYMIVFCWQGWYDSVDGFLNSNISVRVVSSIILAPWWSERRAITISI